MRNEVDSFKKAWFAMWKTEPKEDDLLEAFPDYTPTVEVKPVEKKAAIVISKESVLPYVLRAVSALIAIVCSVLSVFFTRLLFIDNLGHLVGTSLSVAMVAFMVISFSLAMYIKSKGYKGISFLLKSLGILIMAFSMLSTIAGQYNNASFKAVENADSTKSAVLELLKSEEATLLQNISAFDDEILNANRAMAELEEGTGVYNTQFWKQYRAAESKKKDSKRLSEKREEIKKYMVNNTGTIEKKERKNFYTLLQSILKVISADNIEFLIYVFPAIFIDIMAPLGLFVALK